MSLDDYANDWSRRLSEGKTVYRVRVRRLLQLANAERRGWAITRRIADTLERNGLRTDPDFQSTWIDGLVSIELINDGNTLNSSEPRVVDTSPDFAEGSPSDPFSEGAGESPEQIPSDTAAAPVAEALNSPIGDAGVVEVSVTAPSDAIIRISSIPSANRGVVSVLPTDSISKAATLMSLEGYSQLAIMQGQREVRGMITWESIAKRSMLSPEPQSVADCRVDAHVIDSDAALFDALPTIERFGYVLARSKDKLITGIITAADFAVELGERSYAFISLRTIEMLIRKKLHSCVASADLQALEEHSKARVESDLELLTFGENIRLMERPEIWSRLDLSIDKSEVLKRLLDVRDIRNEIMHFSPDPLGPKQKKCLQQMEDFLRQVFA